MWRQIQSSFVRRKARVSVVKKMIELGIRVGRDKRLYVGDVEIDDTALAKATGVDRRVVRNSVEQILRDEDLRRIFTRIRPVGASLVDVADQLGYTVLVISADPHRPGVIAGVTSILAEYKMVVRQALADDPDLNPDPRLTIVVDGRVPGEAIDKIQSMNLVKSLTIIR